jgi:predicted nucleic acid-binding protein
MTTVFVDSYYFLAVLNNQDQGHARAIEFAKSFHGKWATTEWVLMEVGDALAQRHRRLSFCSLLTNLQNNPRVTVVAATHDSFTRGVELYASRLDKEWSLTDCISFAVMDEHGIREALTGDHHFEQAGYVALLA